MAASRGYGVHKKKISLQGLKIYIMFIENAEKILIYNSEKISVVT